MLVNKVHFKKVNFYYTMCVFIPATTAAPTHCEVVRLRLLLIGPALGQCHFGGGATSGGLVR